MVISILSNEAEASPIDGFIAASQWPARTLLATRRDVLPLPPASEEMADFSAKIRGITHVAFNPQQEHMHGLARNFAALSDKYETIALMPGGVVLKQKSPVKSDSQANRTRHATSPLQHSAE